MKYKKLMYPKSPLRFPGSKSKTLKKFFLYLLYPHHEYREAFLGGGSIFLGKPLANNSWLNDKDEEIYNFWLVVRDNPHELIELIKKDENYPTVDLWLKLKKNLYESDPIWKAFKFLFYNRTNYSGIYNANPIGGLNQTLKSTWQIDCRWNTNTLCKRILDCSEKLQNVTITALDYKDIIMAPGNDVLIILDPPYYHQGKHLYKVSMSEQEHKELASLLKLTTHKFLLTIDNCEETRDLYKWAKFVAPATWAYTVNSKKEDNTGKELLVSNFDISTELHLITNNITK